MSPLTAQTLQRLLGLRRPGRVHAPAGAQEPGDGFTLERLTFDHGRGPVPALILAPDQPVGAAVVYCHAHGHAYGIGKSEAIDGRPALSDPPLAIALARSGVTVLAADMPGFGQRQGEGGEDALAKAALWRGETLLGQMLADQLAGFDLLAARPGIDARRIGAVGLSMGATLAYWLAALQPRLAAVAHLCAFSDIGPLIATGGHDLHGNYMTVPGLLQHGDMGDVAALIAPRPQLVCAGLADPLTPPGALNPALARLADVYLAKGAEGALRVIVDPVAGHEETTAMRAEVMAFFGRMAGA